MKKYFSLSALIFYAFIAQCQSADWANNISCILYSHCTSCHNPNGIAPFSLLSYGDALSNASGIKTQVQNKTMPPFLADVTYQQYAHQKTLTQDEIDQISDWVNNGAPGGDTTLAPPAPVYSSGSVFNNPDFSAAIPVYNIPLLSNDEYRCFVISNPFPADEFITAMEVLPGNRAAVHHVLIFSDDSNIPVQLDTADPAPGYVSFGGTGSPSSQLIGGYVPGSDPYYLPANMGMFVPAGSRIIIQVHYPVSASGLTDSTRINFMFSPNAIREANNAPVLNHSSTLVDGPLFIPANTIKTFHAQYTVPVDVSVLSIAPHAHLVCTSMTSYGIAPGGDTIKFEHIPHWDFHWQGAYYFQKPLHIPAGTILYGEATYDNTTNNPENPNFPPQDVSLGESTTDEMMLFYFVYVLYQPGDENIAVDTTGHLEHYLNCSSFTAVAENAQEEDFTMYPNPSTGILFINAGNAGSYSHKITSVNIFDVLGKDVYTIDVPSDMTGTGIRIDLSSLQPGVYSIHAGFESGKAVNRKLVIAR